MNIAIDIAPHDRLNPGFGYALCVQDATTGESILDTAVAPDTGRPLLSVDDCLRIVALYYTNSLRVVAAS